MTEDPFSFDSEDSMQVSGQTVKKIRVWKTEVSNKMR